jgi:hypothetical protein
MGANGKNGRNGQNGPVDLTGVTFGNVDLADRELVARVRERDLEAAEVRIKEAVRRLQQLGIIDAEGRRLNKELPPDMREDSTTDFGG